MPTDFNQYTNLSLAQQYPTFNRPINFNINTTNFNNPNGSPMITRQLGSAGVQAGIQALTQQFSGNLFKDSEIGRNLGTIFSSGVSSAGNTLANNILKGGSLFSGMEQDTGSSMAGAAAGIAGNYIGKGINSLGGDSMLSRGIGQGVATGIGSLGGTALNNIIKGGSLFAGLSPKTDALKAGMATFKNTGDALQSAGAAKAAGLASKANLAGLGMSVVGSALEAAFGPSKEYGGKYGGITRGMDTAYDVVKAGIGFIPGGQFWSGMMEMNKGLSNLFGSTSGNTVQDAVLGSAFMPAPVKWINQINKKTLSGLSNQSWQNDEKTNTFMQNAYGNLGTTINKAKDLAGDSYGLFSGGQAKKDQAKVDFAENAYRKLLELSDQNELAKVASQYMTSINNQKYASSIQGVKNPYFVKQGMKIFNNATNHEVGMRLLSGAALIDNKAIILCNALD